MSMAYETIEKKFYVMLKAHTNANDSSNVLAPVNKVVSYCHIHDNSPACDMMTEKLRIMADIMVSCGGEKECCFIYKTTRKSIIDESLYRIGVQNLTSSQIQKLDWDVVETITKKWRNSVNCAVKKVFHGERILCDAVFISSGNKIRDTCFAGIAKESALMLLSFPEKLAKCKKFWSPERIFLYLEIYEEITKLWPQIDDLFSSDSLSTVRSQAVISQLRIGIAIRTMLSQFQTAIMKMTSKTAVPGGVVHPITRYVMNYLVLLADYSNSVEEIISNWPSFHTPAVPKSFFPITNPDLDDDQSPPGSVISGRLAWYILLLLCKLDSSAMLYEDLALPYLFLANNWNYVLSKIQNSKLNLLMGSVWIIQQEAKVKQYISDYIKIGWIKVLGSFPNDPTAEVEVEESFFKKFNTGFEEAYRVQSSWVIPDPILRDKVKMLLSKEVVHVYRILYDKYRDTTQNESDVIKYAPEDLENYLSELFKGNITSTL